MLLGITHKSNKMIPGIISFLETRGNIVGRKEIRINEYLYVKLQIKCGVSDSQYLINSPAALSGSLRPDHVRQILNINGIQYNEVAEDELSKLYNILIFERSALFIKQKSFGKSAGRSKYVEEDQCKKIADAAKRAIYLLGLDYGMVNIGLTGSKKIRILSIEDSPSLNEFEANTLFAELCRVIENLSKIGYKEVKMGADPEFMLSNALNGQMIPASQFFPREGVVGCDSIRMPNRQQRPVAELRPKPDYCPLQLLSNLGQAMQIANKLVPYRHVKWLAGSRPFNGYSIGGHIHFSNVDVNNHILRALDTYIGLPLFLIENQATAVKRRNKYGFLADYRAKEYGGFEYRTPGSWLVSPQIAAATLCLAKIVASNYLKLTRNCFVSTEAQRAFYNGDQDYLKILFNDVWNDIKSIDMYYEYEDELQIIYNMVKNNIKWKEKEDIRKTWSIGILSKSKHVTTKTTIGSGRSSSNGARNTSPTLNNVNDNLGRDQRHSRFNRIHNSGPVYVSSQRFFN